MNNIQRLLVSILFLILGFVILFFFLWVVNRKRLFNFKGILLASFGAGIGFGLSTFLATFTYKQYISWGLAQRLAFSGEIFAWIFVGSTVLLVILIKLNQDRFRKIDTNNDK